MKIKCLGVAWIALFLLSPLIKADLRAQTPAPLSADPVYVDLQRAIDETPIERMDRQWLSAQIYGRAADCQRYLKLILSQERYADKNRRMERLRLAAHLEALAAAAHTFGVTLEITDSGSRKGHVSDLDFTILLFGGENVDFEQFKAEWGRRLRALGVDPARADINLFDGNHMLVDWKNPNISAAEHVSQVSREVLYMRGQEGYYVSPGASRETVQKRALDQGLTLRVSGGEGGEVLIHGSRFDLNAFVQGNLQPAWRPAREASALFGNVTPDTRDRTALGSAGENLRQWMEHLSDPKAAHKYVDRIIDNALAPMTRAMQTGPGQFQTYSQLHFDKELSEAQKAAVKEKMIRELYGPDLPAVAVSEYARLFDTALHVIYSEGYDKLKIYQPWESEARRNLALKDPDAVEDPARIANEAERIHQHRLTEVLTEGIIEVLSQTMRKDLTVDGVSRQLREFGGDDATALRNIEKMFAERRMEIVFLFEAVEMLDENTSQRLRKKLIAAAPDARMTRIITDLSKLARAGTEAVNRWLRAGAEEGSLPPARAFFDEVDGVLKPIVGDLDEAASRTSRAEAVAAVTGAVALSAGAEEAMSYRRASQLLQEAAVAARSQGKAFLADCYENMDFFFWAGAANSVISTYQQACLRGGASGTECREQVLKAAGQELLFNISAVERYGGAFLGYWKINQGDLSGLKEIAFSLGHIAGAATALQAYAVASLVGGVYDITYGYLLDKLEDDLIDQALKADLTFSNPPTRSCSGGVMGKRQLPAYPLFGGGKSPMRVPSETMNGQDRMRAAEARFGNAVEEELQNEGIREGSASWREKRLEKMRRYACELPYYERMQNLYPHLKDELTGGMRLVDDSTIVIDSCLDARRKNFASAEAYAEAKGAQFSQCLQRAVESATPAVKGMLRRQVESWLADQPPDYQENFYTTWEDISEGTRMGDFVRRAGETLGADMTTKREKVIQRLVDLLVPQFIYSRYSTEKKDDMRWEMERQFEARAAIMKRGYRAIAAARAGGRMLEEQFAQAYKERARELFNQAQAAGGQNRRQDPDLKLILPGYAVPLGQNAPIEVKVSGDQVESEGGKPQSPWFVVVRTQLQDGVSKGAPPDMIVTPEVAQASSQPGMGLYTLKQNVIAELADGDGRVLRIARGAVNLFDIRPVPTREEQAAAEAPEDANAGLNGAGNQSAALGPQIQASSQDAMQLCADARSAVKGNEFILDQARSVLTRAAAGAGSGDAAMRLSELAVEASDAAAKASAAAQGADQVRRKVESIALGVCEQLTSASSLGARARQDLLARLSARVQECRGLLQQSDDEAKSARWFADRLLTIQKDAEGLQLSAGQNRPNANELRAASGPSGIGSFFRNEPAGLRRLHEAVDRLNNLQQQMQAAVAQANDRIMRSDQPDGMDRMAASSNSISRAQQAIQPVLACRDEVAAGFARQRNEALRIEAEIRKRLAELELSGGAAAATDFASLVKGADAAAVIAEQNAQAARERAQDAALCLAVAEEPPADPNGPLIDPTLPKVDCSRFPNSVGAYNAATGQAVCLCYQGYEWNAARTACIDCLELEDLARAAVQRNLLDDARRILNEGQTCSWAPSLAQALRSAGPSTDQIQRCGDLQTRFWSLIRQGAIADAQRLIPEAEICGFADMWRTVVAGRVCQDAMNQLHNAFMSGNLQEIQAMVNNARQMGCSVPADVQADIRALINSRAPANTDNRQWEQVIESIRRSYEAWIRALRENDNGGGNTGNSVSPSPQPSPQPDPGSNRASEADKRAIADQIRALYARDWYPKWCPRDSYGCAVEINSARDRLLSKADATFQWEIDAVRRLLPCYNRCIMSSGSHPQVRDCVKQCR